MKLRSLGRNKTEIEFPSGLTVFFSYRTPVAAFVPGRGALITSTRYSQTTSKHITMWVGGTGAATVTSVDQSEIDQLAAPLEGAS